MSEMVEVYRGVVYPWFCDQMGHMNAMYYVHMFEQGRTHLLARAGYKWEDGLSSNIGFADVKQEVEYTSERRSGNLIVIKGGVLRIGVASLTTYFEMKDSETNVLAAISTNILVRFDLNTRKSIELSTELREGFQQLLLEKAS